MTGVAASGVDKPLKGLRVMVMAGGTGGHVFPGLAVAQWLMVRGATVTWLGTRAGIEARLVPAMGFDIDWLDVTGLRGKSWALLVTAPVRLLHACWQAAWVLRQRRPHVVIGMGGFASGPGGLMAALSGRPLLVHEQNAVAGMTNRWLSRFAKRVLEAFPGSFPPAKKLHLSGNPVRIEMLHVPTPEQRLAARGGSLRLLVVGGSLGAKLLNEVVPQALAQMPSELRPQVRHQTGERTLNVARQAYWKAGLKLGPDGCQLSAFIDDMSEAYAWADLVICRSGALTIAELAAVGVASILVPYPWAVDDHQALNAAYLVDAGAALMFRDQQLEAESLAALLADFAADRGRLLQMAIKARAMALPNATDTVGEHCLAIAGDTWKQEAKLMSASGESR